MGPELTAVVQAGVLRLRAAGGAPPAVGLVLGSGLGGVAEALEGPVRVAASEIPGYPRSTVEGHAGEFHLGTLGGVPVAILRGRIHGYEGHPAGVTALPARILGGLGVRLIVLTNAAGGIHRDFRPGDLMLISDHLNLSGRSPLEGPNVEAWGPRFPDLSAVYPPGPRNALRRHAESLGIVLRQGVYAQVNGPQYETPAEIRMLRILGADAVGMSTVPEAIAAAHQRIPVLGISLITNLAAGMSRQGLSHEEVLGEAARTGKALSDLLVRAMGDLAASVP